MKSEKIFGNLKAVKPPTIALPEISPAYEFEREFCESHSDIFAVSKSTSFRYKKIQVSQEMGFYEEKTYRHIQWFMNVERLMKICVFLARRRCRKFVN